MYGIPYRLRLRITRKFGVARRRLGQADFDRAAIRARGTDSQAAAMLTQQLAGEREAKAAGAAGATRRKKRFERTSPRRTGMKPS